MLASLMKSSDFAPVCIRLAKVWGELSKGIMAPAVLPSLERVFPTFAPQAHTLNLVNSAPFCMSLMCFQTAAPILELKASGFVNVCVVPLRETLGSLAALCLSLFVFTAKYYGVFYSQH